MEIVESACKRYKLNESAAALARKNPTLPMAYCGKPQGKSLKSSYPTRVAVLPP
jgi:hypothetical protein